jgi:hypothetical protein
MENIIKSIMKETFKAKTFQHLCIRLCDDWFEGKLFDIDISKRIKVKIPLPFQVYSDDLMLT